MASSIAPKSNAIHLYCLVEIDNLQLLYSVRRQIWKNFFDK